MEVKQVIVERVTIYSFKNISNLTFSLTNGETLHIEGRNGLGKSNILNAIYWCLTGYDLNGCSDNAAFVPYGKDDGVVDVEVVLNVGKIERITRKDAKGSITSVIKIDDVTFDTLIEAETEIDKRLGILSFTFNNLVNKDFNLRRFLLNPAYHLTLAPKTIRDILAKEYSKVVVKNNVKPVFNQLFLDLLQKNDVNLEEVKNYYEPIESVQLKLEANKKSVKASKETLSIIYNYLVNLKEEQVDKKVVEDLHYQLNECDDVLKQIDSDLMVLDSGRQTWNTALEQVQDNDIKVNFQTITSKGIAKNSFNIESTGIDLKQCSTSEIVQDSVRLVKLWKDNVGCNINLPLFIDRAESMNLEKIRELEELTQVLLTKVSSSRNIKINGSEVK